MPVTVETNIIKCLEKECRDTKRPNFSTLPLREDWLEVCSTLILLEKQRKDAQTQMLVRLGGHKKARTEKAKSCLEDILPMRNRYFIGRVNG